MTTSFKLRTNGNFVSEAKNEGGTIIAKAGPGSNVESEWVHYPHGTNVTISERPATDDEVAAANESADRANDGDE